MKNELEHTHTHIALEFKIKTKPNLFGSFLADNKVVKGLTYLLGGGQVHRRRGSLAGFGIGRRRRSGGRLRLKPANLEESAMKREELGRPEIEGGVAIAAQIDGLVKPGLSSRNRERPRREQNRHLLRASRTVHLRPYVLVLSSAFAAAGGLGRENLFSRRRRLRWRRR